MMPSNRRKATTSLPFKLKHRSKKLRCKARTSDRGRRIKKIRRRGSEVCNEADDFFQ